jgi:hypothetical protein
MPKYDEFHLLHDITKHTNIDASITTNVFRDSFPEQNTDLLNTTVELLCKDKRIKDEFHPEHVYRPADDVSYSVDIPSKEEAIMGEEYNNRFVEPFKVIRCDAVEPYVFIGINDDCSKLVVASSKLNDEGKLNITCLHYSPQIKNLIGIRVAGVYENIYNIDGKAPRESYIVMSEIGEDCNSVIAEFLDEDTYRLVLEDEVEFDVLEDINVSEYEITDGDICDLRRNILGDKLPYGSD